MPEELAALPCTDQNAPLDGSFELKTWPGLYCAKVRPNENLEAFQASPKRDIHFCLIPLAMQAVSSDPFKFYNFVSIILDDNAP